MHRIFIAKPSPLCPPGAPCRSSKNFPTSKNPPRISPHPKILQEFPKKFLQILGNKYGSFLWPLHWWDWSRGYHHTPFVHPGLLSDCRLFHQWCNMPALLWYWYCSVFSFWLYLARKGIVSLKSWDTSLDTIVRCIKTYMCQHSALWTCHNDLLWDSLPKYT